MSACARACVRACICMRQKGGGAEREREREMGQAAARVLLCHHESVPLVFRATVSMLDLPGGGLRPHFAFDLQV